jgi:Ni,Fe-hydrogenase III large subunit
MDVQNSELLSFLSVGEPAPQRPWPRYRLSREQWVGMVMHLTVADWSVLALWGDSAAVHVALYDPASAAIGVASLDCPDGHFPSLSGVRPGAIRLERAAQDLFGLTADGLVDQRPWLDHGQWPGSHPQGAQPQPAAPRPATQYDFLPVEGEGVHQIAVGPVHAGIIEPGGFRFHCNGEAVVRLEERLGYTHKGTESLMVGKPPGEACRIAGRLSGDSTVACSLAFARAVEAATATEVPARAIYLRAVMGELERIANHLGDIGAICNDAAFAFMLAHFSVQREDVLRAVHACFGHRLMMDGVVPGGVACDLDADGVARLGALVRQVRSRHAELLAIYDDKPSLLDRTVGTGVITAALAHRFAAGGYVGRASGRDFDARRDPGYPPYADLEFVVPVLRDGDVHSRLLLRAREIEASLGLIEQLLDRLPSGAIRVPVGSGAGEGIGLVEGFRGDYFAWVALDEGGNVRRAHLRDPSWFQWPILEAAVENNIVADFPLCNKSFNCSYSGHDL